LSAEPVVLTVHAVDTHGDEGVTADGAAFAELRCRTAQVVTAVLVAGPGGVGALEGLSLSLVASQFESLAGGPRPAAARIGILRDPLQVELVATLLGECGIGTLVVAPVVRVAGTRILDEATLDAVRRLLFPAATVVLARAGDLSILTGENGRDFDGVRRGAAVLRAQGARAALVAGGGSATRVVDLLDDGGRAAIYDAPRVAAPHVAGLAGAHAAALTAFLARGETPRRAVDAAQRYIALRLGREV
jgi:hydroxymethylpyrimidine/phosphomethylpyrimidine kinase